VYSVQDVELTVWWSKEGTFLRAFRAYETLDWLQKRVSNCSQVKPNGPSPIIAYEPLQEARTFSSAFDLAMTVRRGVIQVHFSVGFDVRFIVSYKFSILAGYYLVI
jgi:hypothetical protein